MLSSVQGVSIHSLIHSFIHCAGDEGVLSFADVMERSSNPQRVRMSHNSASAEALQTLAAAYKACRMRR
jgi:hypothetical protein